MDHRSRRGRDTRGSGPRIVPVALACLLIAVGSLAAACGGSPETTTTAAPATTVTTAAATTDTTVAAPSTPAQLGEAIGATWEEAMQGLNGLLDDQPDVADVKDQVAELKEEYIEKLVAYGEQKAELDASGKAQVDAAITSVLNAAASEEWYLNYKDIWDSYAYMSGDVDFVNLISSFNILTQYADFDLLKKQAPEEAKRLGIE